MVVIIKWVIQIVVDLLLHLRVIIVIAVIIQTLELLLPDQKWV